MTSNSFTRRRHALPTPAICHSITIEGPYTCHGTRSCSMHLFYNPPPSNEITAEFWACDTGQPYDKTMATLSQCSPPLLDWANPNKGSNCLLPAIWFGHPPGPGDYTITVKQVWPCGHICFRTKTITV